jgi:hypothetical protein
MSQAIDSSNLPQSEPGFAAVGEPLSMGERLIVAPAWGRVQPRPLIEGQTIEEGAVIGLLREGNACMPLVCHVHSIFLSWLISDGERVHPGKAVARLLSVET